MESHQIINRVPSKQQVRGSSPCGITKRPFQAFSSFINYWLTDTYVRAILGKMYYDCNTEIGLYTIY